MRFRFTLITILLCSNYAFAATYNFHQTAGSGVNLSSLAVNAKTDGTLIGNWDAAANPTGTRTKPGLFGGFGSTENVAVPTTVNPSVSGAPNLPTAGGFFLDVDLLGGTAALSGYNTALDGPGSSLNVTAAFGTPDGFRTRTPSSVYPGGTFNVPLGTANITNMVVSQNAGASLGTVTPIGVDQYQLVVATTADLTIDFDLLGQPQTAGPISIPLALTGILTLIPGGATLTSAAPIDVNNTQAVDQALSPFDLALPTILPPGSTANVVMTLHLSEISALANGTLTNNASGVSIPEPVVGVAPFVLLIRRRPRR